MGLVIAKLTLMAIQLAADVDDVFIASSSYCESCLEYMASCIYVHPLVVERVQATDHVYDGDGHLVEATHDWLDMQIKVGDGVCVCLQSKNILAIHGQGPFKHASLPEFHPGMGLPKNVQDGGFHRVCTAFPKSGARPQA